MRANGRLHGVGAISFFVACGLAAFAAWGLADDKEIRGDILKLADMVAKKSGDEAGQAEAISKKGELEDFMGLFRLRNKKGLGVGTTPGAIKPDGIEAIVMNLSKRPLRPAQLAAQSDALARAAQVAAAIALVAQKKCPVDKKQGEKDPKNWQTWTEDMYRAAMDMATAAEQKRPKELHVAVEKLYSTCTACHGVFRD